jgi:hypothetical protein
VKSTKSIASLYQDGSFKVIAIASTSTIGKRNQGVICYVHGGGPYDGLFI